MEEKLIELVKALRCYADTADDRCTECGKHEDCATCPYDHDEEILGLADAASKAETAEILHDAAADAISELLHLLRFKHPERTNSFSHETETKSCSTTLQLLGEEEAESAEKGDE